jgi:hypothetical protein
MNNDPLNLPDDLKLYIHVSEKFYKELLSYNIFANSFHIRNKVNLVYNKIQSFKNEYEGIENQELSFRTHLRQYFYDIYNFYYNTPLLRNSAPLELINSITNYTNYINGYPLVV